MKKNSPDITRQAAVPAIDTRAAGAILLLAAIVSVVFVALDPEVSATGSRAILEGIVANRPLHQLVHAIEMACVMGLAFGFLSLGSRLGLRRPAVLGACLVYVTGCLAMVGATVLDGFVTGDISSYYLGTGHDVETGREMLHLCYAVLQDLAMVSWFMQAVGVVTMASVLVADRGIHRVVGYVGLATGALPPIAILATYPVMDTPVVVGILLAQLLWNVAAAMLLLRKPRSAPAMDDVPAQASLA